MPVTKDWEKGGPFIPEDAKLCPLCGTMMKVVNEAGNTKVYACTKSFFHPTIVEREFQKINKEGGIENV
jgi:hypothetical protein